MSVRAGQWLVAYDIACPRRLARVHRLMTGWGLPAQYSVFLLIATREAVGTLVGELAPLVHPRQDDVRIFRLEPGWMRSLGAPTLPRGVLTLFASLADPDRARGREASQRLDHAPAFGGPSRRPGR